MYFTKILFLSAFILPILFMIWDNQKQKYYIYDQNKLHALVNDIINNNENPKPYTNNTNNNPQLELIINALVANLSTTYPASINTDRVWMFNNAGGAMGAMYIMHASLTEYLIIFGTPVGTEGHTGRYWADDYFIILKGEQWAFRAGQLDRMVFKQGQMHHLPRGVAEQYRMPADCWALEYAKGWIPLMLPFGVIDTFTSTLDFPTLGTLIWTYAKCVVSNLVHGKI